MSASQSSKSESVTAVGIAVIVRNEQVLVGQRSSDSVLAGLAEFPGGKLRADESGAAAAERECREETGIEVRAERLITEVVHAYDHGTVSLSFYLCEIVADQPPKAPFCWVDVQRLREFEFPPANREVLGWLESGGANASADGR